MTERPGHSTTIRGETGDGYNPSSTWIDCSCGSEIDFAGGIAEAVDAYEMHVEVTR